MSEIRELYMKLEQESAAKGPKGQKAGMIRTFVEQAVKEIKQPRIKMAVLRAMTKQTFPKEKIDLTYFNGIVAKMFETEKGEDGYVYILTQQRKQPKAAKSE